MKNGVSFSGMVFWGSEFLPKDILLDMNAIRQWAVKSGMVSDPELQLVTDEKIGELGKMFNGDDALLVLIHLYKDEKGKLCYFEYPFVPVKTLIKKKLDIKLAYWTWASDTQRSSGFRRKIRILARGRYLGVRVVHFRQANGSKVWRPVSKTGKKLSCKNR